MEHKHEPYIALDGLIHCRTCGEILPEAIEEIAKVSSARRARRILEEVAIAGHYYASSWERNFTIYARERDDIIEEIAAEKLADRDYVVRRKLISKGGEV